MSQRSITLSLLTLLAGAVAGAALMAGHEAPQPRPAAALSTADANLPSVPAWRGVPETYPAIEGVTEADVNPNESNDALGNVGEGP